METKLEKVSRLLEEETLKLTSSIDRWKGFLKTSTEFYKYGFTDQILITTQRPTATICASFDLWTGKLGRKIKQNSKGIPLVNEYNGRKSLRFVFDIADTAEQPNAVKVGVWRMKSEYEKAIVHRLTANSNISKAFSLNDFIDSRIEQLVPATIDKYLPEIIANKENSLLEELDDLNCKVWFENTLKSSVAYAAAIRCGIEPAIEDADLHQIGDFNTVGVITQLGRAVNEISAVILREIEKEVRYYDRQIERSTEQLDISGKEYSYGKDNKRNASFLQQGTEQISSTVHNGERSDLSDRQGNTGVLSPVGDRRGTALRNGNVGQTPSEVSERGETGYIRSSYDKGSVGTLSADGQSRLRNGGQTYGGNEQSRGDNRGTESSKSDGMGRQNEQPEEQSERNNIQRNDLHLSQITPKAEEQSPAFFDVKNENPKQRTEYVTTIETEVYSEPDENNRVKKIGNATAGEVFEKLKEHLEKNNLIPDEYFQLSGENKELPDFSEFLCSPNFGSSEGIYLDIYLRTKDGLKSFATGKTLGETYEDFIRMGRIAAECSLMLNGNGMRIRKQEIVQPSPQKKPRRYKQNKKGETVPAFNGKTPDEFDEKDTLLFAIDNDLKLNGIISIFTLDAIKQAGYEYVDGELVKAETDFKKERTDIIGNTPYRYIAKKTYRKFAEPVAMTIADRFEEEGLKYSGRINDDGNITLTFSKNDIEKATKIINDVTEIIDTSTEEISEETQQEEIIKENVEKSVDKPPASNNNGEELIDYTDLIGNVPRQLVVQALQSGSGFEHGKFRIEQMFNTISDTKERAKAIKDEYGIGGFSSYSDEKALTSINYNSKGMTIEWHTKGERSEGILTWTTVEKEIKKLIDNDNYIFADERAKYEREKFVANQIQLMNEGDIISVEGNDYTFITSEYNKIQVQPHNAKNRHHYTYNDKSFIDNYVLEKHNFEVSSPIEKTVPESPSIFSAADNKQINFSKVGDFYEAFGDEAVATAPILEVNLIHRKIDSDNVPMVGIPDFALEKYTEKLKSAGYEVSVSDEPPKYFNFIPAEKNADIADTEKTKNYKPENYRIPNNELGYGTPKEKYKANVAAIRTLLNIERDNRQATPEEQEILSCYVGWGGLPDVFDNSKENWASENAELKELLTPTEYVSARGSTLNAHYTSPTVIKAIYNAISNLGFEKGKILEPSMGTGNFFGLLPEKMNKSKIYGVELDNLTGRIAKQLYPQANIQITGFEKTTYQSNSFDLAIGNVPFGNYRLRDMDFRDGDLIHDFFFKKSLDKIHSGGIIAFITSKGTLDKQDNSVRKYLAERADLLGAVRLPNNAFTKNAGTEVTTDIVFLQKRENIRNFDVEDMPEWVNLDSDNNGIKMNSYFVAHPEMIIGEMAEVSGRFGMETTCKPIEGADLSEQLETAMQNIKGEYIPNLAEEQTESIDGKIADIDVNNYRNYCYAVINGDIYYRVNGNMEKQNIDGKKSERMLGMIAISETLRELITAQKEDYPDENISALQAKLNILYDNFTKENGLLSSKLNKSIFREDDTSALLLSLEKLNDKGEFVGKADIFTQRTIVPYVPIESVDTASEALAVSISEKARVDIPYMSQLCNKSEEEIIEDLKGIIFNNPETGKFENADEYLSGNVRHKLAVAKEYAKNDSKYSVNVSSLEKVQPEDLKPAEISAQLGSTWIPVHYFQQFMYELLETPQRCQENYVWRDDSKNPFSSGRNSDSQTIIIDYDHSTATYGISNKSGYRADGSNIKATQTYGTERMNAYRIIEETLNLKPVKVMDYIEVDGKKRAVLNEKETLLAQQKQNEIKQKFSEWIFDDYERTQDLVRIYNEKFNSERPREYDGKHITFGGINPAIKLREHQVNAIAHTLYGGNTLLAHSVGAGKTFEMVASAMESKRLGLCSKSLIVVPKHIVNQFASEFLQLYPTANILVPNENDFSKDNRERFCSRIATGNYDAIILSHTQLEKIPMSIERQIEYMQSEIDEIIESIEYLKAKGGERGFTVKQMENTKRNLEAKLEQLNNDDKRDTEL